MAHGTASGLALRTTSRDAEVGSSVDRRTVVIDDLRIQFEAQGLKIVRNPGSWPGRQRPC